MGTHTGKFTTPLFGVGRGEVKESWLGKMWWLHPAARNNVMDLKNSELRGKSEKQNEIQTLRH